MEKTEKPNKSNTYKASTKQVIFDLRGIETKNLQSTNQSNHIQIRL